MPKAQHTPGPWFADLVPLNDSLDSGDDPLFVYVGDDIDYRRLDVCTVHQWALSEEITRANATLISAAPEMLEALERALPAARARVKWREPTTEAFDMAGKIPNEARDKALRLYDEAVSDVNIIEAAIAKAKGQDERNRS